LHIWNFEKLKAPIHSIKGSNGPLLCGQWNPHNSNELMISGVSKNLKLLDYRQLDGTNGVQRFVAWKKNDAHSDSIRDLKWNPMIPHWVATAGNDGIINVWDLRYNGDPVISLEGHDNIVRRLSWSRDHVELLASGGIDQQVKIWSLKVQPHYIVATITEPFNDSIVGGMLHLELIFTS
jgi:WD40 repeat protein